MKEVVTPSQATPALTSQVLAVTAFLQDLGGTATVKGTDVEPVERFGCVSAGGGDPAEAAAPEAVGPPEEVFATFGCVGCHQIAVPVRTLGPPLHDVGARLSTSELYESILEPDATMAEGDPPYPPGLMGATLEGNGFYERMTAADYRALVEWLAGHGGLE
ncbi:MAG TPA: c-type cytochrome [Myxococcota bacterium]|nr:c-type cytochrome [Myxococcota bacterium]